MANLNQPRRRLRQQRSRPFVAGVETLDFPQQRHGVPFRRLRYEAGPEQRLRLLEIRGDHCQGRDPLVSRVFIWSMDSDSMPAALA